MLNVYVLVNHLSLRVLLNNSLKSLKHYLRMKEVKKCKSLLHRGLPTERNTHQKSINGNNSYISGQEGNVLNCINSFKWKDRSWILHISNMILHFKRTMNRFLGYNFRNSLLRRILLIVRHLIRIFIFQFYLIFFLIPLISLTQKATDKHHWHWSLR